ncbi:hypothetical protein [Shewanella sp.]|uniref:hypothetical protein n=1 Tax=Shewanella sp. TaxID=50422 RepID=UPI003D0F2927
MNGRHATYACSTTLTQLLRHLAQLHEQAQPIKVVRDYVAQWQAWFIGGLG